MEEDLVAPANAVGLKSCRIPLKHFQQFLLRYLLIIANLWKRKKEKPCADRLVIKHVESREKDVMFHEFPRTLEIKSFPVKISEKRVGRTNLIKSNGWMQLLLRLLVGLYRTQW